MIKNGRKISHRTLIKLVSCNYEENVTLPLWNGQFLYDPFFLCCYEFLEPSTKQIED